VHAGAHADAPSHYAADGEDICERDLDFYLGPCEVIRVPVAAGGQVRPADLQASPRAERVLLATGTYPDPDAFNDDFAACTPALIDHLGAAGVRLIGIDTPSVDLFSSTDLPVHRRCLVHDMAILEGLVLAAVPAGIYELIALPLPLAGFDASPVRAVLRTFDQDGKGTT
ncbi:MAG: cyclase family protein, partial [Acidobacteriota bacterium]